jgi:hypothetical protein
MKGFPMTFPFRSNPDLEGPLTAVASPVHVNNDGRTYFVFSVSVGLENPVCYLDLASPAASATVSAIASAMAPNTFIQVGLSGAPNDAWRQVEWVQVVCRRPI